MIYINKKDITRINQEIGENGKFHNESSLDFALAHIKKQKSWLYESAYIARSLLVDHAFEDGNKRTALTIIIMYMEDKNLEYDDLRLPVVVHRIAKKNIRDINKIVRLIKNAIIG